jgi:hypothetical protein
LSDISIDSDMSSSVSVTLSSGTGAALIAPGIAYFVKLMDYGKGKDGLGLLLWHYHLLELHWA